ncbi:hypothetical protein [Kitasatospora sp. NPDC004289]
MRHLRTALRTAFLAVAVTALAACGPGTVTPAKAPTSPAAASSPAATPTPTATPSPTPTPTAVETPTQAPAAVTPAAAPAATTKAPTTKAATPKPATTAPAAPRTTAPAAQVCEIKSNAGNCYNDGQFCRKADLGRSTHDRNGEWITCKVDGSVYRWIAV